MDGRKDSEVRPQVPTFGRRDLMKLGAGAVVTTLTASVASAESPATAPPLTWTHAGWKNDVNRASGNGPVDDTTRQIVDYTTSFSVAHLTEPVIHALSRAMIDSIASLISGFESEPARICARLARKVQSTEFKSTVLGYGVTTSPEMATFANGSMLRNTDFNDLGPGGHASDTIAPILAIGEALHCSGRDVLVAITLAYELLGSMATASDNSNPRGKGDPRLTGAYYQGGWDGPFNGIAIAMGVGKLLGLNQDQLANALSLAVVPHLPMRCSRVGHLSHWKGCHSSQASKDAVWAALMAREGMTGPPHPFEARDALFDHVGPFELRLPLNSAGPMVVQMMGFKRTPSEGSSQAILEVIPQIRAWTRVEEIASIQHEMPFFGWQEIADPPKWDPRNHETADHSIPYLIARALIDGEIYLDSFTPEKIQDPAARELMARITVRPNVDWRGNAPAHITVRTKAGAERSWDSMGGLRMARPGQIDTPMSDEDIHAKFDRACAFMSVANQQRDRARAEWSNLGAVQDMAAPMRTLANFGRPLPL
jgi:2-methylcitrate dehydratase